MLLDELRAEVLREQVRRVLLPRNLGDVELLIARLLLDPQVLRPDVAEFTYPSGAV